MSRPRSAAPPDASAGTIGRLLRHGARFLAPAPDVQKAAEWLLAAGIIEINKGTAVRCADPRDGDFPPSHVNCPGIIPLRPSADEGGGDYRCPECDRPIYPDADGKATHPILTTMLDRSGVERFLLRHLGAATRGRRFEDGVLVLSSGGLNASVVLPEFCCSAAYLGHGMATGQPVVYVTVEPDAAARMLQDDAIAHVALTDLLLGRVDLSSMLRERLTGPPRTVANLSIPIYAFGAAPKANAKQSSTVRQFVLRLSSRGLQVDDLTVVAGNDRRETALRILRVLLDASVAAMHGDEAVQPMSVEQIADRLDAEARQTIDVDSIRRTINRLQQELAEKVRRETGNPIGEDDIIESVARKRAAKGAQGYRINPRTVVLAPMPDD